MFNFQAVAFAIILAVVALGVDYQQQSQKADLPLGELSASEYVKSITGRFADVQQAKAQKVEERERKSRQRAGARVFLPEAPEGWTRRAWDEGDNSRISTAPREMEDFEKEALESNAFLKKMAEKSARKAAAQRNAEIWVYENDGELVSVRAQFVQRPEMNAITNNAIKIIKSNMGSAPHEGWAVIQGVAFGAYESLDPSRNRDYLVLGAAIGFGDEVILKVRSTASEAATREILERIDYDGLNNLLPRPLAHVGSGAEEVDVALQGVLARRMIKIRNDLIRREGEAAQNWLKSAASPEDAMTLALRQTTGLDIEGTMGDADAELARELEEVEQEAGEDPGFREAKDAEDDTTDEAMLDKVKDWLKGGTKEAAATQPEPAPAAKSKITCAIESGVKRCRIGG